MHKARKVLDHLALIARDVTAVKRAKLAAVIFYKGEPIAFGVNRKKTHSFQARFSRNEHSLFLHAETDAIKNASKRITLKQLSNSVLYVARVKFDLSGNFVWGLAKPCEGCERAIKTYGIKEVYYTKDDNEIGVLRC